MAPRLAIGGGAASRWMPSVCNALPLSMAGREEAAAEAAAHGPTPTPTPCQPYANPNPNPNPNHNPNPNPNPKPKPNPEWRQRPPHKTPKALAERHTAAPYQRGVSPGGGEWGREGGCPPSRSRKGAGGVEEPGLFSLHITLSKYHSMLYVYHFLCAYVPLLLGWL